MLLKTFIEKRENRYWAIIVFVLSATLALVGVTLAHFHTEEKVPLSMQWFIRRLRGKEIVGAAILSICAASPSDPVALWDRILCNNLSDSEFSLWQICYSTVRWVRWLTSGLDWRELRWAFALRLCKITGDIQLCSRSRKPVSDWLHAFHG